VAQHPICLPPGRLPGIPKAFCLRTLMSKLDFVSAYYPGSSQDGPPDKTLPREECHRLKKQNLGFFASHGRIFQFIGPRPAWPVSSRFAAFRDESASIQEATMNDYVDGQAPGHKRAVEAIGAWQSWDRKPRRGDGSAVSVQP
jgi:hypothetical protein